MTLTPLLSAGAELAEARLEIVEPPVDDPIIPFKFNPTEYQLKKSNTYSEVAIPGLESPAVQYVRGAAETLSMDLLLDTSDTLDDVRVKYVDRLRDLMRPDQNLHAPPIVAFVWNEAEHEGRPFTGVLESMDVTFLLFDKDGVPLRARLAVTLKEYRPAAVQVLEQPRSSADVEKTWVVRRGDSLRSIAGAVYRDPTLWRELASANGVDDPRRLAPGTTLRIPRLR